MSKILSIRSRLVLMLILVSVLSAGVLIYIGYTNGKRAIRQVILNQLTGIKAAKKNQIESYFSQVSNITEIFGENEMVKDALSEFKSSFSKIGQNKLDVKCTQQLHAHYLDFVEKLSRNLDIKNRPEFYYPNTLEACYLQYEYIIDNPNPLGEKYLLSDTEDGSAYNLTHQKYHQFFTDIILKFGFYDVFLIDLELGDIVYTTYKENDFATNLYMGPYRESNLAQLTRHLKDNADIGKASFVDFRNYRPSYGAPAAFVGIPVTEGLETIGALVFQFPVDEINKIMTGDGQWEKDGLGASGETYLVGKDFSMRSISRFYLQDTLGFTQALLDLEIEKEEIDRMYRLGTTILKQKVKTEASVAALQGKEATRVVKDYRHIPVLSSYALLNIRDLEWAILSEIDLKEAYMPIYNFQKKVFVTLCIIVLLVTFLAMYLAGLFVRPIDRLTKGVRRIRDNNFSDPIKVFGKDEFGELARSFNIMMEDMGQQKTVITKQSEENEKLLSNFIPVPIVQRLQKGEKNIADAYPNVSLIAIDIVSFTELTKKRGALESVSLLNQIVEAFDNAAQKHHIEKIRTVGDTYFAACGLLNPRFDHARKLLDFALEVRQLIPQFNINHQLQLSLHIGIHSGEVIAGIVGQDKFNYDLWGETVNTVFRIMGLEADNLILVSDAVMKKLQDLYPFEQYELKNSGKIDSPVWKYSKND